MELSEFRRTPADRSERVQIYVDGSNLYHGLKAECGSAKLDYLKFSRLLANGRKLIRLNYYCATLDLSRDAPTAKGQQKFLNSLRHVPYVAIRHRPMNYRRGLPLEKGVDVLLATDMLTGALRNCYDTAILVSGDGDFVEVLEEIKRAGKQVENATFSSGRSDALINAADLFVALSQEGLEDCFR